MFKNISHSKDKQKEDDFYVVKLDLDGYEFDICIHPAESAAVLIIYPGANGDISGYENKYLKIANLIQKKQIATVVRMGNLYHSNDMPYSEIVIMKLTQVIEYVNENIEKISNRTAADLYLAGVSASAGVIATLLWEYSYVKKVLLISPAESAGRKNIEQGLKNYKGEVYITAGDEDEIHADKIAKFYYDSCQATHNKKIEIIPKCDHHFSGEKNGMILSNAFLWAFASIGYFPKPRGGVVLYK